MIASHRPTCICVPCIAARRADARRDEIEAASRAREARGDGGGREARNAASRSPCGPAQSPSETRPRRGPGKSGAAGSRSLRGGRVARIAAKGRRVGPGGGSGRSFRRSSGRGSPAGPRRGRRPGPFPARRRAARPRRSPGRGERRNAVAPRRPVRHGRPGAEERGPSVPAQALRVCLGQGLSTTSGPGRWPRSPRSLATPGGSPPTITSTPLPTTVRPTGRSR